jgi:hypothetical protein|tara:strand:- start:654 stop:770 length:117 start_codon:yes stop_codon:yes gene_type:complete
MKKINNNPVIKKEDSQFKPYLPIILAQIKEFKDNAKQD